MPEPRHLLFLFVDHFEPDSAEHVRDWVSRYAQLAARHRDSGGRAPQHTWFYWATRPDELAALKAAVDAGLGEVELHLHHDRDTAETLTGRIREHLAALVTAGLRSPSEPVPYAFIHGKWALDNSRGGRWCGVNNELQVLRQTGCFADFTFPAWGSMQPRKHDSIYYATDDPERPKSYDTGVDAQVGRPPSGDLLIFQGPGRRAGHARLARVRPLRWLLDCLTVYPDITACCPATPRRIRNWVQRNIHVKGRPEWVFVKCHTHGARREDYDALFGPAADAMYSELETRYNDGREWRLHYVTAREACNIVRAAEKKLQGDPELFRGLEIAPYVRPAGGA